MSQYIDLDLQSLMDLLIVQIKQYDQMVSSKVFTEEEFTQIKRRLAELHAQIKEKAFEMGYPMDKVLPSFPEDNPAVKRSDS